MQWRRLRLCAAGCTCTSRRWYVQPSAPLLATAPLVSTTPSVLSRSDALSPALTRCADAAAMDRVMSPDAVRWATNTVDNLNNGDGRRGPSFFDAGSSQCLLCDTYVASGYKAHQQGADHRIRQGVARRVLALLYTFYCQAMRPPSEGTPEASTRPSKRRSGRVDRAAAAVRSPAASGSVSFDTPFARSPLFDEEGVPPDDVLFHRPQELLTVDLMETLIKRWWRVLERGPPEKGGCDYDRLLSLSADDLQSRLSRLRYLIYFLTSRGVLQHSTGHMRRVGESRQLLQSNGLPRSSAFERFETVGDGVFKALATDRLRAVFPRDEGAMDPILLDFNRLLDSNHGLLAIYNLLDLDGILGLSMANNKGKADVIESLVGELNSLLVASEVQHNVDAFPLPGERATAVYLRSLVRHTLNDFAHVVTMWQIESTLRGIKGLAKTCLEMSFFHAKGSGGRRGGSAQHMSEEELIARAPRNAPMPLLLPWERRHPSVRTSKDEAGWAMTRRPPRPPSAVQQQLCQLMEEPAAMPAELSRLLAVDNTVQRSSLHQSFLAAVEGSRAGPSSASRSVSSVRLSGALPDFSRCPQHHHHDHDDVAASAVKAQLCRESCVVMQDYKDGARSNARSHRR